MHLLRLNRSERSLGDDTTIHSYLIGKGAGSGSPRL